MIRRYAKFNPSQCSINFLIKAILYGKSPDSIGKLIEAETFLKKLRLTENKVPSFYNETVADFCMYLTLTFPS